MTDSSKEVVPKSWLIDDLVYNFWGDVADGLTSWEISDLCAGLNPYYTQVLHRPSWMRTELDQIPSEAADRVAVAEDIQYKLEKHHGLDQLTTKEWFWVFRELNLLEHFPVCYRPDRRAVDPETYGSIDIGDLPKPRLNFMERESEFFAKLREEEHAEREGADYSKGPLWQYLNYDSWTPYEAICLMADLWVMGAVEGEPENLELVPPPSPILLFKNLGSTDYYEFLSEKQYSTLSQEEKIKVTIGEFHIQRFTELRQQWIRDLTAPNNGLLPKQFYIDWAKNKKIEIPWLELAQGNGYFLTAQKTSGDPDDSITFRKDTLLKVIAAMAIDSYEYERGAARQKRALSEKRGASLRADSPADIFG